MYLTVYLENINKSDTLLNKMGVMVFYGNRQIHKDLR